MRRSKDVKHISLPMAGHSKLPSGHMKQCAQLRKQFATSSELLVWSRSDYVDTMTSNGTYNLRLNRASAYFFDWNRPADVDMRGNTIIMNVYDALFRDTHEVQLFNLVHEQAHVWDAATGGSINGGPLSRDMMKATGSSFTWYGQYQLGNVTSSQYVTDQREDWAETVAAAVYPGAKRSTGDTGNPQMGTLRQNYIRAFLPDTPLFNGTYKLNKDQ